MNKTLRLVGPVVLSGGLLLWSHFANPMAGSIQYTPPSRGEEDGLRDGLAILRRANWPMRDVSLCDPLRAIMANDASPDHMEPLAKHDVVLCFRDGIDFPEARSVARQKGLVWQRGLGGSKIQVFAPSRARFLQVADENSLELKPGDIRLLGSKGELRPQKHIRRVGDDWLIPASDHEEEVLFGPYAELAPGSYRLEVTFEADGKADCETLPSRVSVRLAVTRDARKTVIRERQAVALTTSATPSGACRLSGAIEFESAGPSAAVETPIWIKTPAALKLTGYRLEDRLGGKAEGRVGTPSAG